MNQHCTILSAFTYCFANPALYLLHKTLRLNTGASKQTLFVSALCLALDKPAGQSAAALPGRGEAEPSAERSALCDQLISYLSLLMPLPVLPVGPAGSSTAALQTARLMALSAVSL